MSTWTKQKLGAIYKFQYGKGNTNPSNGGQYPVYGAGSIIGYFDEYNAENSPVIGHMGANCGTVIFGRGKHFVTYNGIMALIKEGNDSRFGYYTLLSKDFRRSIRGSAQPFISYDLLNNVDILLPDLQTQTRIASVLSAYDDLIEDNEKRIKALEEMAQLLYTEWFVKFEFPVNSPPSEGWQAKPDGVVSSPPEAGCLKGGVVSPRNTQNYMSLPYNPKLKERAKELRKAGNLSEVLFWQQVKNGQFKGFDFDRQKIIGNYIIDFYCSNVGVSPPVEGCPQGGVVIEIDGSSHDDKQDYDKERDTYLSSLGLTVVHILDSEVKKNLEGVMVWLNDHPAFQAPVQELPPRLSGTPPKEGNNSSSLKGWQAKPDGVVGYKDAGGKMVDSGTEYGMIPEGWEVKRLGELADLIMGQSPISEHYNLKKMGLPFHQGVADFGNKYPTDRVHSTHGSKIAEKGDLLFSVRAPVGRMNIANKKIILGRGLCAIRRRDNLQALLYSMFAQKFTEKDMIGNGAIYKSVNKTEIENIKFLCANRKIEERFETITSNYFGEIEKLTRVNENLSQTRDLLIPQLVTGKREVK